MISTCILSSKEGKDWRKMDQGVAVCRGHGDDCKKSVGEETFSKRKELLREQLDRNWKKRMIKSNAMVCHAVWITDIWDTRKEDIQRPDALEMCIWRRMEKSV